MFARTLLLASVLAGLAQSHSWVEEYQVIGPNGSYTGSRGFSRGYVARTDSTFNGFSMSYQIPSDESARIRLSSSDHVCHPAQRTSNYTNPDYPMLQVQPGSWVALKYLENGHVSLPWSQAGKPKAGGTVFVYGTTQPSEDDKMVDVLEWTADGSGGNGKGFLLAAQNFDDGRCYEMNCGNISLTRQVLYPNHVPGQPQSHIEQWCESNVQIPTSQPAGKLTTYWIWQWPTNPGMDCIYPHGKDEYYTTCADFEIVTSDPGPGKGKRLTQENGQTDAVKEYKSRGAYTLSPPVVRIQGDKTQYIGMPTPTGSMDACPPGGARTPAPVPTCAPLKDFSPAAYQKAKQMDQELQYLTWDATQQLRVFSAAEKIAAATTASSSIASSESATASSTSNQVTSASADLQAQGLDVVTFTITQVETQYVDLTASSTMESSTSTVVSVLSSAASTLATPSSTAGGFGTIMTVGSSPMLARRHARLHARSFDH